MAKLCELKVSKLSLKESESPFGTGRYLGTVQVEAFIKEKLTISDVLGQARVALSGYATEILFYPERPLRVGCDDLVRAEKWVKILLGDEDFKKLGSRVPLAPPGPFDIIADPIVRANIVHIQKGCVRELLEFKPLIEKLAYTLYERDELSGDEFEAICNSY
jgi:hypothetical protein